MDIHAALLNKRILRLRGGIDDRAANMLIAQLLYLEQEDAGSDITIHIDSAGGSVASALAIYDCMQLVGCPISTVAMGQAGNAAALLVVAGTPGKRSCIARCRFVLSPLPGTKTLNAWSQVLARHTGQPGEYFEELPCELELDATQALKLGFVDRIA